MFKKVAALIGTLMMPILGLTLICQVVTQGDLLIVALNVTKAVIGAYLCVGAAVIFFLATER